MLPQERARHRPLRMSRAAQDGEGLSCIPRMSGCEEVVGAHGVGECLDVKTAYSKYLDVECLDVPGCQARNPKPETSNRVLED